VTPAASRRFALSLPETEERQHMNHPDFRVAGKIFARLGYPDKTRHGEALAGRSSGVPIALERGKTTAAIRQILASSAVARDPGHNPGGKC